MPGSDSNEILTCKDVATALSKNDLNEHAPRVTVQWVGDFDSSETAA